MFSLGTSKPETPVLNGIGVAFRRGVNMTNCPTINESSRFFNSYLSFMSMFSLSSKLIIPIAKSPLPHAICRNLSPRYPLFSSSIVPTAITRSRFTTSTTLKMKEAIVAAGPKVEIKDSPIPEPGSSDVVIKVVVSGSNPKDWFVYTTSDTSSMQRTNTFPCTGNDLKWGALTTLETILQEPYTLSVMMSSGFILEIGKDGIVTVQTIVLY